jgi:hypothetical protein
MKDTKNSTVVTIITVTNLQLCCIKRQVLSGTLTGDCCRRVHTCMSTFNIVFLCLHSKSVNLELNRLSKMFYISVFLCENAEL